MENASRETARKKPLENGESNRVTFCGLCCDDCFARQGKLADMARDLRKELRAARFEKTAEALGQIPYFAAFRDYPACYEVLGAIVKFRCGRICREDGGPPNCKIRNCCRKKGIEGCWECEEYRECDKFTFLERGHGDANKKNLDTIRRKGMDGFLQGNRHWYLTPKSQE
jgi:hypothetical protein